MKKNKKKKKKNIQQRDWRMIFFALGVLCLFFGLLFALNTSSQKVFFAEKKNPPEITETRCAHYSIVNGVCAPEESDNSALFAVMIENHPDSAPQAGLGEASVVYEASVEGVFSRFLAFYKKDDEINKIGPVRSARSYYLDWLAEWGNPVYMHVGGSPQALEQINARGIASANEFFFGHRYWRDYSRRAPHNVYTNSEKWEKITSPRDRDFTGWKFIPDTAGTPCETDCVTRIRIPHLWVNSVEWNFSASSSQYVRLQDNKKHRTEGADITADTIVIQEIKTSVIDEVGRLAMKTVGQGTAAVFYNGKRIDAVWKKESVADRTRFYDAAGAEIPFKPGKIWIEIVPRFFAVEFVE